MDKETLWRAYCDSPERTRVIVDEALSYRRGYNCRRPIDQETYCVMRSGDWPDDGTIKRIDRVIRGLGPSWVPKTDLTVVGVDVYLLGVMDGKRMERGRRP